MKGRSEKTGIAVLAALVMGVLISLMMLVSCNTKKTVTETLYVHDTLFVSHTDTFMVERWNTRHDTIQMLTERVVTLLQSDKTLPAETVKVVVNNARYRYVYVGDSSLTARSVVDSLLSVLDQRHDSVTVKAKTKPPWKVLIFGIVILMACVIVLKDRR